MARIAGVNIPTKQARPLLRFSTFMGIGAKFAQEIIEKNNIDASRRVNELSDSEVLSIRETIDRDYMVEGDLRRDTAMNIKRLMDLGCYPRPASSSRPSGPWPADAHERTYPQGSGKTDRR